MCRAATLALALLCLVAGSRQLSITEIVVPAAVEVGSDAELRCRYKLEANESEDSLFVKWWVTRSNAGGDRAQLYQRFAGEKGRSMKHNLVIKDDFDTVVLPMVTANDSGVYECEVSNIDEVRQHRQLTVFTQGDGPQLNISTIPDGADADSDEDVLVECRADDVAPEPDIVLTIDGIQHNMTESVTGPDSDGLYDIAGNATFSKADIDGYTIRCELFFLDETIAHPQYIDDEVYNSSGEETTTATAEDVEPEATIDSVTEVAPSGSIQSGMSLALLLAVGAFTQLPAFL